MIESEAGREKFEQLYRRYRSAMFYTAMQILQDVPNAEDAVHQAFLSILENLDKIDEPVGPRTQAYVLIIIERKAIDIIRSERNFVEAEMDRFGMEFEPPGTSRLADAMAKLPSRYREIVLLRYHYGYSTRELAKLLGMKRDSVEKLLWRAKERLKQGLSEGGEK